MKTLIGISLVIFGFAPMLLAKPVTWNLWPGEAPSEKGEIPPEYDKTGPDGNLVAGKRVIRLTNVSIPTMTFYKARPAKNTGTTIVIAPGGGFNILAYDLEGTEVAEWLNSIGVNAAVLKYRVPARDPEKRWLVAVQDAQRAMSMIRSKAGRLDIDPDKIGLMGFSAGASTASITTLANHRFYDPVDKMDNVDFRPNFAMPIYGGGIIPDECTINENAPPFFLTIAHDDKDRSIDVAEFYVALKKAGVSAELHIYERGGHGYGLRRTEVPVTSWSDRLKDWLQQLGLLEQ